MKTKIISLIIATGFLFFTAISFAQNKEERNVDSFTKIGMSVPGHLYLTQGSPQKVVVEASEDILEILKTEVKESSLRIKFETWKPGKTKPVNIWITVPEIEGLSVAGSGNIVSESSVTSDEIELEISGSGQIKLEELKTGEVEAAVSGSGDIYLTGTADEMDIKISGSGNVFGEKFSVDECGIKISGSGSCKVDATEELEAVISGSGKIYYYGNPQMDVVVSGSGKVKKAED